MLTTLLLTLRIASLLMTTGHDATDSHLFAMACTRNATPLVSAERLCAVALSRASTAPAQSMQAVTVVHGSSTRCGQECGVTTVTTTQGA